MKNRIALALTLSFFGVASSAQALTLAEKKQVKEWNDYLKDESQSYVKSVKDKCGIDLPLTMDEKLVTVFMGKNANAASYCDSTREGISSMCEDETSKKEIIAKIKSISCKLGKGEESSYSLKNQVLTFTVGPDAGNLPDKVKAFLEKSL